MEIKNVEKEVLARGSDQLTELTIPDSVTKVGKNVFSNCIKLKLVKI